MKLGFLGNMNEPLHYFDDEDKSLIKKLSVLRKEDFIFFDISRTNPIDLTSKTAINLRTGEYVESSIKELSALILLETSDVKNNVYQNNDFLRNIQGTGIFTVNPISSFFELEDKMYLFEKSAIQFPESYLITDKESYDLSLEKLGVPLILKPLIGFGGRGVKKITEYDSGLEYILSEKKLIAQEFLDEIKFGEKSLFFFDREFKYAILKVPKEGEFKSNFAYCQTIKKYVPTQNEVALAKQSIDVLNSDALVQRIDIVGTNIIEMTAECPGLFSKFVKTSGMVAESYSKLLDKYVFKT